MCTVPHTRTPSPTQARGKHCAKERDVAVVYTCMHLLPTDGSLRATYTSAMSLQIYIINFCVIYPYIFCRL